MLSHMHTGRLHVIVLAEQVGGTRWSPGRWTGTGAGEGNGMLAVVRSQDNGIEEKMAGLRVGHGAGMPS